MPTHRPRQTLKLLVACTLALTSVSTDVMAEQPSTPQEGATRTHYNIVPGYAATSEAHKFAELVQAHQRAWRGSRDQPYMPTLSVGWDKRPWEGKRGLGQKPGWYFPDRTPEQLAAALESAIAWMDQHPDQTTAERIVLLYAWNEFGEGGYLAPTKGDPERAYLKVVKSLETALWAFHNAEDFREAVLRAVNLGDDADTTGAVCGQFAGAYWGEVGIPTEWLERLAEREMIEKALDGLLGHEG
jgi:hypothetical protein